MYSSVYQTMYISIIVQAITGIIDFLVLFLKVPKEDKILIELVGLEIAVQVIEAAFYVWLMFSINKIKNITSHRYYDWMITTPTMLITLSIYLLYLSHKEDKRPFKSSLLTVIKEYWDQLCPILVLNMMMLAFGYLGEIGYFDMFTAVCFGFIAFFLCFALIFEHFARLTDTGTTIFFIFAGIWSIYGFVALLSHDMKNSIYNILDLFAKNFFGIYLAYTVYQINANN